MESTKDALIEAMTDESLPLFTTDRTQPVRLRMGENEAGDKPLTVMEVFQKTAKRYASQPALHQKIVAEVSAALHRTSVSEHFKVYVYMALNFFLIVFDMQGTKADDTTWTTWTWKEYEDNVYAFAKALMSLGFEKFDTINIIGFNSPEWFMANFGAIAAGGVPAGTYTTNLPEACKYVASHSEAKVIVCEGVKQLQKYLQIATDLPKLKALVMYGPDEIPDEAKTKCSVPVYKFDEFLNLGKDIELSAVDERIAAQRPNETCTLIYTSGTTGNPKAVMITHDNLTWVTQRVIEALSWNLCNEDHMVSFLPLSHIAAQMLDMHCAIHSGLQVWFAQPDALRGSIGTTLKQVRPTMFFGVPRVWEKIYDKMQEVAKQTTGVKKTISTWAKAQCLQKQLNDQYGTANATCTTGILYPVAHKLISQVHVALGLDRCKAFFTAAAPIEYKVLEYFASIGIPIYEVFGQSECKFKIFQVL